MCHSRSFHQRERVVLPLIDYIFTGSPMESGKGPLGQSPHGGEPMNAASNSHYYKEMFSLLLEGRSWYNSIENQQDI